MAMTAEAHLRSILSGGSSLERVHKPIRVWLKSLFENGDAVPPDMMYHVLDEAERLAFLDSTAEQRAAEDKKRRDELLQRHKLHQELCSFNVRRSGVDDEF